MAAATAGIFEFLLQYELDCVQRMDVDIGIQNCYIYIVQLGTTQDRYEYTVSKRRDWSRQYRIMVCLNTKT